MWKIYLWSWRIGIHLATQKRCVLPYLTVFLRIFSTYLMKNKILTKNLHRISHFFIYCYFDCWYCIHRRKVMTHPDSILKSRDITLPTKVHLVKALVFPVVMYGCESWTIMKAEHWRIDAFKLWCWRRLLRVPWATRRSNQSILKEINPEYSLEGLMLKLQYFGRLKRRSDSLGKTLMLGWLKAGGEGYDRGWDVWMASPTRWARVRVSSGSWWRTRKPGVLLAKSWIRLSDWTELNCIHELSGKNFSYCVSFIFSIQLMPVVVLHF